MENTFKTDFDKTVTDLLFHDDANVRDRAQALHDALYRIQQENIAKAYSKLKLAGKKGGPSIVFDPEFKTATVKVTL